MKTWEEIDPEGEKRRKQEEKEDHFFLDLLGSCIIGSIIWGFISGIVKPGY